MELDKLTVKLRPRNPWEGIDLGFALARRWFLPLWLLWLAGALPLSLLLNLLPIPLWAAGVLAWWCKPLYEPPLLFWLGRVVFGERIGAREMRRHWPAIVWPQLLANLTWRRFSPSRSFIMPVAVLEGLQGKTRVARIRVLSHRQHAAGWLTLLGIHFEIILELGFLILLVVLLPEQLQLFDLESFLFDPHGWELWLQQFSGLLAMSIIAPFYVAGGFGLYLTRRGQLEAWDVELGLRRLAERLPSSKVAASLLAGLLAGVLFFLSPAKPLQAMELDREQARSLIQSVMEDDDFGQRKTLTTWKYIGEAAQSDGDLHWLVRWLLEIFQGFTQGLAAVGELLMWLAVGALVAYLIYWFNKNRALLRRIGKIAGTQAPLPVVIAGLDIRPESLPADIATQAERLLQQGQARPALSLLYRGALSALVHRHRLEIPGSATEGECLLLAQQVLTAGELDYQERLTRYWQALAYGHRLPAAEETLQLCHTWASVYGEAHG